MKRGVYCGLLMTLAAATGCRDHRRDVVVIEMTHSYHTAACARVKMANTEIMPIDEARSLHLKPCPVCKPDQKIK